MGCQEDTEQLDPHGMAGSSVKQNRSEARGDGDDDGIRDQFAVIELNDGRATCHPRELIEVMAVEPHLNGLGNVVPSVPIERVRCRDKDCWPGGWLPPSGMRARVPYGQRLGCECHTDGVGMGNGDGLGRRRPRVLHMDAGCR